MLSVSSINQSPGENGTNEMRPTLVLKALISFNYQ